MLNKKRGRVNYPTHFNLTLFHDQRQEELETFCRESDVNAAFGFTTCDGHGCLVTIPNIGFTRVWRTIARFVQVDPGTDVIGAIRQVCEAVTSTTGNRGREFWFWISGTCPEIYEYRVDGIAGDRPFDRTSIGAGESDIDTALGIATCDFHSGWTAIPGRGFIITRTTCFTRSVDVDPGINVIGSVRQVCEAVTIAAINCD